MLLLTGDFYTAQDAYNWGEVDKVVPPERMEETALVMANKLASFDQKALRLSKQALWKVKNMTKEEARLFTWSLLANNAVTEDSQKSMKDFKERVEKVTRLPYIPGAGVHE